MSLFVLGRSRSGKTPFAAQAAMALGWQHLSGSEWVRRRFPATPGAGRADYVQSITAFSLAELRRNPRACVEYLRGAYDLSKPFVAEGLRNPHDFVHLFDPRADAVVFLDYAENDLPPTGFERGLDVIRTYLEYLADTGLWDPARGFEYRFHSFYGPADPPAVPPAGEGEAGPRAVASLDAALLDFLGRWKPPAPPDPTAPTATAPTTTAAPATAAPRASRAHADVPPIQTHVRGEYLYDMDLSHAGEHLPCTAFAVSSYAGSVPTFKILLADGTVFSYVPPGALVDVSKPAGGAALELADLVYHNCPDADLCVHRFDELRGPVQAYFKRKALWLAGEYLFTLDWYTGNDLLHLIALENGQYAFLPHHKVKFKDGPRDFQPFRKMRRDWKV